MSEARKARSEEGRPRVHLPADLVTGGRRTLRPFRLRKQCCL